jgi:hypothetical protein
MPHADPVATQLLRDLIEENTHSSSSAPLAAIQSRRRFTQNRRDDQT